MPEKTRQELFEEALGEYEVLAHEYNRYAELTRVAHAEAYLASDGKTADLKKAAADIASTESRKRRDHAEVERDCAYHMMISLRGSAGENSEDFK